MEINECASTKSESNFEILEFLSPIPKGLAAIPDSILPIFNSPSKPNLVKRLVISVSLLFFNILTFSFQLGNWFLKSFFGYSNEQKKFYRELHSLSKRGDMGMIEKFLIKHSEEQLIASYLFSEFWDLPELHSYFSDILEGANICLVNDRGFFCRRWSEHIDCKPRISSHTYQKDQCFEIGHLLFWLDLDGNTRFQFENSPLNGFFSMINHAVDYLRYSRDNEQQGVMGTSPHTEHFCLKIKVDPSEFIIRKLN